MALFSVWDWDRNAYRIYATNARVSVGDDPSPPRPFGVNILGAVPDLHMKPLPSGARFMGVSHVARGEIVRDRGGGIFRGLSGLGVPVEVKSRRIWLISGAGVLFVVLAALYAGRRKR